MFSFYFVPFYAYIILILAEFVNRIHIFTRVYRGCYINLEISLTAVMKRENLKTGIDVTMKCNTCIIR